MRGPLRQVVLLLGVVTALAACGGPTPERIVLIVIDTLRRDHLSVYGSEVKTPQIDALAARGQVFENVTGSFHQTSMSMAALFTGRTPSIESGDPTEILPWNSSTWCGMARFASGEGAETCIPRGLPTLAEKLREAGFWTIGVTSNQFLYEPSGFSRGFDDWTEVDERKPLLGRKGRKGIARPRESRVWSKLNRLAFEAVERASGRRAFLYVHYIDVHDYHHQERTYAESVVIQDESIGKLLAGLEERGFLDDAVVVLTSDHGERLGEDHRFAGELPNNFGHYGNPSWEEMLRIPLIVAPPVFEDTERFLRTQDFFGLLQEIAGLSPERFEDTEPDELFLSELFYRTYRKGRWKTVLRRSDGKAHLYDLGADPQELADLAADNPLVVLKHRMRANELTHALQASGTGQEELSEDDRARLEALGYLDELEE